MNGKTSNIHLTETLAMLLINGQKNQGRRNKIIK